MGPDQSRPAAESIKELDLHLSYMRASLLELIDVTKKMATKEDIQELKAQMSGFATKEELQALDQKLARETVSTTLGRWLSVFLKIGAAVTLVMAIAGGIVEWVHFVDKVGK